MTRIAHQIQKLRVENFQSLEDLAFVSGLNPAVLTRLENGDEAPTLEVLETVAMSLGVPLYRLFYDGGETPTLPHLLPRVSWQELLDEAPSPQSKIGRLWQYVSEVLHV